MPTVQELSNDLERIWEEENQGIIKIQVDKLPPEIQDQILLEYTENNLPPDKYKEELRKSSNIYRSISSIIKSTIGEDGYAQLLGLNPL